MEDLAETGGEFNLHDAADEIISETDSQDASTESTEVEGQVDEASQQNDQENALSPEEILNQVASKKEDPAQFAELLKGVNSLGMVRNGLPVNVENPEQLKELIQKGFDYTQKTMEHAEVVKAKEVEFQQKEASYTERETQIAQKEQGFQNELYFNQNAVAVINDIHQNDPELFEHFNKLYIAKEQEYAAAQKHTQKFSGDINALKSEIESLKGQKHTEALTGIKQGWEKELSEVQTKHAASLSKLGIKVDFNKVKETWSADATGKTSVEQALYATYGKEILAAHESQAKLLKTKATTSSAMLKRSGVNGGQRGATADAEYKTGDYGSFLRDAVANM